MKKRCVTALMLAAALTLTACGSNSADSAADQTQETEQTTESTDAAETTEETTDASAAGDNKVTELTVGTPTEIGGQEFTVTTELAYPDEDDEIIAVNAVYGDQTLKLDESLQVSGIYEVTLDGQEYVLTETTTFDDYGMIYVVKLDGSNVTLVSKQDGHLQEMPTDPTEGFPIETRVDVLGVYGGIRTYTLQDDKLVADGTMYQFQGIPDGTMPELTVKGTIDCRLEGGNTTLKAGDVIIPKAYSEDGTFYFEMKDGTAGNFQVDLAEDEYDGQMTYAHTIGGVDEYELFEDLPYAG